MQSFAIFSRKTKKSSRFSFGDSFLDGAPNRRKLDSIMVAASVRSERGQPASLKPPVQHAENKHVRDDGFVTPLVALRGFKKTAAELGLL